MDADRLTEHPAPERRSQGGEGCAVEERHRIEMRVPQGHGKVAGLPELRDGIAVRRIHIKNVVTLMHAEKTRINRCDNNRGLSRMRQAGWARAARRGRAARAHPA